MCMPILNDFGLILSEATSVDPMGVGYPDMPGIWSDAQVEGWGGFDLPSGPPVSAMAAEPVEVKIYPLA